MICSQEAFLVLQEQDMTMNETSWLVQSYVMSQGKAVNLCYPPPRPLPPTPAWSLSLPTPPPHRGLWKASYDVCLLAGAEEAPIPSLYTHSAHEPK